MIQLAKKCSKSELQLMYFFFPSIQNLAISSWYLIFSNGHEDEIENTIVFPWSTLLVLTANTLIISTILHYKDFQVPMLPGHSSTNLTYHVYLKIKISKLYSSILKAEPDPLQLHYLIYTCSWKYIYWHIWEHVN